MIDEPFARGMRAPAERVQAAILRAPGWGRWAATRGFTYLAARTLFYDQFVARALAQGIEQVLVLAGGYDGRAWRLARDGARFFEVDLPAT